MQEGLYNTECAAVFGTLSVETFLRDYWQQRPLLIRQAFPGFESPVSPDELAGLACETDTSRIVIEKGGRYPWEVRHGAFEEEDFADLPGTHWTLLVNDADLYLPELKQLIEPFRFIPDWRIDDLMISFAVEGGSVGPHVDEYDVFLIQAQGRRRWQITNQPATADNFIPDLELRIMRDFRPEQEWVLEPGDMLYLPPNVPHYGVALDDCMTYSVGFRAPSGHDMLEQFMEDLLENPQLQQRFRDPQRHPQSHSGELSPHDAEMLLQQLCDSLNLRPQAMKIWLGKYLSRTRVNPFNEEPTKDAEQNAATIIKQRGSFFKSPAARLVYLLEDEHIFLFFNGKSLKLQADSLQIVQSLCQHSVLNHAEYSKFSAHETFRAVMDALLQNRVFFIQKMLM